jgi:hypothetical protein
MNFKPSNISIKALMLSNLAFWAFFLAGVIIASILCFTGAGLMALGHSATTIDQVMSSPAMIGSLLVVGSILAPLVGGYTAASIAPNDKLLHGVLSTSVWLVFCVCCDIWTPDDGLMPRWLDLLSSYWVPLPALAGAYICQWRAMRPAVAAAA